MNRRKKISNVIYGGDGKVLIEDNSNEGKSTSVTYSGDGKRMLSEDKG
jgi:hypothetical protein